LEEDKSEDHHRPVDDEVRFDPGFEETKDDRPENR
jgi:hypothetical protein